MAGQRGAHAAHGRLLPVHPFPRRALAEGRGIVLALDGAHRQPRLSDSGLQTCRHPEGRAGPRC